MKEERQSETLYDKLCRDWVGMFIMSVNVTEDITCTPGNQQSVNGSLSSDQAVSMGWALPKPRAGSSRFTDKVKNYFTARFDLGEQTRCKADPQQVSNNMRTARDEQNNWLLAANRRRQQHSTEIKLNPLTPRGSPLMSKIVWR